MAQVFRFSDMLVGIEGPARVEVYMAAFNVLSVTPCGMWIDYYGTKKFIKTGVRKKFACLDIEEARESYRQRKLRQIKILKKQLRRAEEALAKIDEKAGLLTT